MEEKEAQNTQTTSNGFTDVFLSKLKEQSFTIVLMIGVIWYQGRMMEERVAYWQKLYEEQKSYIQQTTKEDRAIMLDRIKYLEDQRDKYAEDAINELKSK
jgi:exosome complex RNA-binding protein Rrp4